VKTKWLNENDHSGFSRFDYGANADTHGTHFETVYHAIRWAKKHPEMEYDFETCQMLCVPDTDKAWHLFRWMKTRFDYCGECNPTKANHIQIDATFTKTSLHKMYVENCRQLGYDEYVVSSSYFNAKWFDWFGDFVTITETKAVAGKQF